MTNYNERLNKILRSLAHQAYLTAHAPGHTKLDGRTYRAAVDEAKQANTSLIKELVEEAKPVANSKNANKDTCFLHNNYTYSCVGCQRQAARVYALAEFEQNLLKELEEV